VEAPSNNLILSRRRGYKTLPPENFSKICGGNFSALNLFLQEIFFEEGTLQQENN
jgi:hypothetical protein